MMPDAFAALIVKAIGSVCGAALALIFTPPRSWRGFFRRASASLIGGMIFAATAREMAGLPQDADGLVAGACLAAFTSWAVMAAITRIIGAWQRPKGD